MSGRGFRILALVFAAAAAAGCGERAAITTTPAMRGALDAYAPGFRRFTESEYARGVSTAARATGDFNGAGIEDVTLYGHDGARELLFVLLSFGTNYRAIPLLERPLTAFQNGAYIHLDTRPPGPLALPEEFKKLLDPKPPARLAHAAIDVGFGNEAGVLYYWDGRRFVEVPTGD